MKQPIVWDAAQMTACRLSTGWSNRAHFEICFMAPSWLGYDGNGNQLRDVLHIEDLLRLINIQIKNFNKLFSFDKDRKKSMIKAEKINNNTLAILDDGLQDKSINYDLSIACFNSTHTIGNGFLIPAGPLRESLFEIRNYDAVFLNGEKTNIKFQNKIKKINKNIKIFYANYKPTNLKSFNLKKNYLIFCGLGNSEEFEKTLIKYKFKIKEKKFFPDHYNFSNKDINEIKSLAKEKRLEIVTSEKDYLRLDNSKKKNIKFIKVDLKISNQKKFESFLNKNL